MCKSCIFKLPSLGYIKLHLSHILNEPFVLRRFCNIVHWSFESYSELWQPSKCCDLPHHSWWNCVLAITSNFVEAPATFKLTVTNTGFPNSNFHLEAQLCLGNECCQFSLWWQLDFICFRENVYQVFQCEWLQLANHSLKERNGTWESSLSIGVWVQQEEYSCITSQK